jgi:tetratricopeptide (TPR) repeat protein
MRCSVLLLLVGCGIAAETTPPMPTLPPEPRTLQLTPGNTRLETAKQATSGSELSAEVQALRRALERVRSNLDSGSSSSSVVSEGDVAGQAKQRTVERPSGEVRASKLFGPALSIQPTVAGGALVSADVGPEQADRVISEIANLLDASLDEVRPAGLSRQIELRVKALPYPEAIDRLLGQIGLRWREEGTGKARRFIVETRDPAAEDLDRRARRALERVAAGPHGPAAAEAMYLLAAQDAAARRHAAALRGFGQIVDAYGADSDKSVAKWVQLAARGSGEAMLALGAIADARIAFRAWLARAEEGDPEAARILLLSAEAARRMGSDRDDPGAYDEAVDDLHRLLESFADEPRATTEVAAARLALGELLFEAGRQALGLPGGEADEVPPEAQARFREAEVQIGRWLRSIGKGVEAAPDQASYWLAECAFNLGRSDEARPRFEKLYRSWKDGATDAQVQPIIYSTAAYRIGETWLRRPSPDHVRALFAFLRARQDFPQGELEPYLLVRIAQCYAELESEDQAVEALYALLRNDQVNDARPGRQQLDQLLGELVGKLGSYPGPVRARVLFYIARAQWLHAKRDRTEQTASAKQAAATYRRVLDENPPPELRQASILGMARSQLLAGDDEHGEATLARILRDPTVSARDREYAAQLLGEHLRSQGRLREAIQAFRGEVPQ